MFPINSTTYLEQVWAKRLIKKARKGTIKTIDWRGNAGPNSQGDLKIDSIPSRIEDGVCIKVRLSTSLVKSLLLIAILSSVSF